jgi:hypothetical protein
MIMITEQPAAVAQKTGYDTDVQGLSQAQRWWLNDNKWTGKWHSYTNKCIWCESNNTVQEVCSTVHLTVYMVRHNKLMYCISCTDRPCTVHDTYFERSNYIRCSKCPPCHYGQSITCPILMAYTCLKMVAIKSKSAAVHTMWVLWERSYSSYSFFTLAWDWGEVASITPQPHFIPGERGPVAHSITRLTGPQSQSGLRG